MVEPSWLGGGLKRRGRDLWYNLGALALEAVEGAPHGKGVVTTPQSPS